MEEDQNDKKSYRSIIKGTALFGGVQIFQVLINIIRVKFVAILLGPIGVGISALLQSTTTIINQITELGINYSSVRDVSLSYENGDVIRISRTVLIVKRCLWVTGIFGAFVCICLSSYLSKWTFGNYDYKFAFIWLSGILFLNTLSSGYNAILQGARQLQYLAKASIIGSTIGLFSAVPLYYFFATKGIVPAIIITSFTTFICSYFFINKVETVPVKVSFDETLREAKSMVRIGIALVFTGLITNLVSYLTNLYISRNGGPEMVGLYQAGWGLTTQYVGLVFAAMSTDYYPRLSSISKDNMMVKQIVNQQAEVALFIMTPILLILITSAPLVIHILLSQRFMVIIPYIQFIVLGMLLKATSWSTAFIILAKGDTKLFFYTELVANIILLGLNLLGYHFFGLKGLGLAFILLYAFYVLLIYFIVNKKHNFKFTKTFLSNFVVQEGLCIGAYLSASIIGYDITGISINAVLIIFSIWYSYTELDKRIGIKELLLNKLRRADDKS